MPAPFLAAVAKAAPAVISGAAALGGALNTKKQKRIKKRYTQKLGERIAAGGDLVSDVEMQEFKQGQQEAAEAGLKAQQMQLGQAAKAAAGAGPFMEQQYQKGAEKLAKAQAASAVEQASAAAQYKQAREAQIRQEWMQLTDKEVEDALERERMIGKAIDWYSKAPPDAFGNLVDTEGMAGAAEAQAGGMAGGMAGGPAVPV
jgi:hypothetical protein